MIRKISLLEKDYVKGRRAIKRLKEIKPDVEIIRKASWRIKNRLKKWQGKKQK